MKIKKQQGGALWMGMAAVLTMTSAVAAQFQASSTASSAVDLHPVTGGVVSGSVAFQSDQDKLTVKEWINLGNALAGIYGNPFLKGTGSLAPGQRSTIVLESAAAMSPAVLIVSLEAAPKPFKGGVLVPELASSASFLMLTGSGGGITLSVPVSPLPAGLDIVMQFVIADAAAAQGVSLSNALQASTD